MKLIRKPDITLNLGAIPSLALIGSTIGVALAAAKGTKSLMGYIAWMIGTALIFSMTAFLWQPPKAQIGKVEIEV